MKTPASARIICLMCLLLLTGLAGAQQKPVAPGTGLRAQYYDGTNFEKLALTRTDPTIDFNWTIGPDGNHFVSPGPGVPGEYFSVRWSGHIYAPVTGAYKFQITTDDGMRVWVGDQRILNSWRDQQISQSTAHIILTAGRYYSIRVEYYQASRDSKALLAWQIPDTFADLAPVPTSYLYTSLPATAKPLLDAKPAPPVAAVPTTTPAPAKPRPAPAAAPTKQQKPVVARPVRVVRQPVRQIPQPNPAPTDTNTQAVTLPDASAFSKGAAVPLPNLYFTQSKAALLPTSRPTLNALARLLRQQPTMRLEIAGHTDNVGDAALNLRLSEQRARVVRQYLVQQGIDSVRLVARGYGSTRPVADNRDVQQRARNRRVEVVVQ